MFLPMLLQEFKILFPEETAAWSGEPEDFTDAPDCDLMAHHFLGFVLSQGILAQNVIVRMSSETESALDEHHFTVLDNGVAIDWTAKQFHNCQGMPLEHDQIESPLLFAWPGSYPLPGLTATEVRRWPAT